MKKILIGMVALGSILHAGLFSAAQGMAMEEVKPTKEYTIDTNGINPRVYEFNLKTENKTCVLVVLTGTEPSSTLQCFDNTK